MIMFEVIEANAQGTMRATIGQSSGSFQLKVLVAPFLGMKR